MACSAGISRTQGPHHDPKKLRTTGFPRSASSATAGRPARTSSREKVLASPESRSVPGTLLRLSSVARATPATAATSTTPARSHQPRRRRRGPTASGSRRSGTSRSEFRRNVRMTPPGYGGDGTEWGHWKSGPAFTGHGGRGAEPQRVEKPQALFSELDCAFSTRATPEPGGRRAGGAEPHREKSRRQAAPPASHRTLRREAHSESSPVWSPEQWRQGSTWSQERRTRVSSSFRPTEKAPDEASSSSR